MTSKYGPDWTVRSRERWRPNMPHAKGCAGLPTMEASWLGKSGKVVKSLRRHGWKPKPGFPPRYGCGAEVGWSGICECGRRCVVCGEPR